MFEKISRIIFSAAFILMLVIPAVMTNWKGGGTSETENRTLASFPEIIKDGEINDKFTSQMDTWLDDNIGLREELVYVNAQLQYKIFNRLASSKYMLGPGGELNYVDEIVLASYSHADLLSEQNLNLVCESFQTVKDYLDSKNIQFYYIQNYDKQSIYPEEFPAHAQQIGTISLTDQVVNALKERTDVNVISMKELMLTGKQTCRTYNKWADVTHWSQRGAFMGYQLIINTINANNDSTFKILSEDDYNITLTDQGNTLLGGIHWVEMVENFELKNPKAYRTDEKFTLYAGADYRQTYWTNDNSGNDTKVLICGDSYIYSFFIDDLAESFHETLELWAWTAGDLVNVIEEYQPDIFIYEKAEREPAFLVDMVSAAEKIKK